MRFRAGLAAVGAVAVLLSGCSGGGQAGFASRVAPTPRRTTVWLSAEGVDGATAVRLAEAGVDQLVAWRGTIRLSGGAPVVQLLPRPPVEGPIPTAVALELKGLGSNADAAGAVWAALEADFGSALPTELILDLPNPGESTAEFVTLLARESGLAVVPLLTLEQLRTEVGSAVAAAAHRCIVPIFGSQEADLRGINDLGNLPLRDRLEILRGLGVKVRAAAALRPKTAPVVGGWAQDLDPLTDGEAAEIQRTSTLDRSFAMRRPLEWAGRTFGPGEVLAVAWVDAAKLGLFFGESERTVLPEIEGWDLVSLPPEGSNLGLDREELIRYLMGEGPQPSVDVRVQRSGRTVTVTVVNTSCFRSAVTGFGNWVQIELASGALVATSRGSFDRIILGSLATGQWQPNPPGGPDAVRFAETYVAPGEELKTGTIRLPSSRSSVTVRWQIQLSDGSTVGGVVE